VLHVVTLGHYSKDIAEQGRRRSFLKSIFRHVEKSRLGKVGKIAELLGGKGGDFTILRGWGGGLRGAGRG